MMKPHLLILLLLACAARAVGTGLAGGVVLVAGAIYLMKKKQS